MYSFTPVEDISNYHYGFYLIFAVFFIIEYILLFMSEESGLFKTIYTIVFSFMVWVSWEWSYTPNHPLNQQVTGYYVTSTAEVYVAREGKHDTEHHDLTVTYRVPAGNVTLKACWGCTYPQTAILYKN